MEFLVRQSNRIPADFPPNEREALRTAERRCAQGLREAGTLLKLWRVPGTSDAIGLYDAPDATALHEALSSLPMFAWMTIHVEALAVHPQERADS